MERSNGKEHQRQSRQTDQCNARIDKALSWAAGLCTLPVSSRGTSSIRFGSQLCGQLTGPQVLRSGLQVCGHSSGFLSGTSSIRSGKQLCGQVTGPQVRSGLQVCGHSSGFSSGTSSIRFGSQLCGQLTGPQVLRSGLQVCGHSSGSAVGDFSDASPYGVQSGLGEAGADLTPSKNSLPLEEVFDSQTVSNIV
jgi:hypothetical protein